MRPRAWALIGIWVGMISLGSGACRSFNDYCTEAMDCVKGNDADIEACEAQAKAAEDIASNHGCSEWFDAFFECVEGAASCRGTGDAKVYTHINPTSGKDPCEEEAIDYAGCMND
jgi:hypothetical protein